MSLHTLKYFVIAYLNISCYVSTNFDHLDHFKKTLLLFIELKTFTAMKTT